MEFTIMDEMMAGVGVYKNKEGLYCYKGKPIGFKEDSEKLTKLKQAEVVDLDEYRKTR